MQRWAVGSGFPWSVHQVGHGHFVLMPVMDQAGSIGAPADSGIEHRALLLRGCRLGAQYRRECIWRLGSSLKLASSLSLSMSKEAVGSTIPLRTPATTMKVPKCHSAPVDKQPLKVLTLVRFFKRLWRLWHCQGRRQLNSPTGPGTPELHCRAGCNSAPQHSASVRRFQGFQGFKRSWQRDGC